MITIFKYTLFFMSVYFSVNWMADNPAQVDHIRNNLNHAVKTTGEVASSIANGVADEVTKQ